MDQDSDRFNWSSVEDKDIPVRRLFTGKQHKKVDNYFYIPATEQFGLANSLCRNCLAVYALLTTARAMHPNEEWHTLPYQQLEVTGLDRYQVRRAVVKLEKTNLVEANRRRGHKTRYRLLSRK